LFFTNRLCPYAHRVWWALEEKGVAAEVDYIHIELGQNKPGWYQSECREAAARGRDVCL